VSLNHVSSIAKELGHIGYYSAFFHGAPNGSMYFMAYANQCGFNDYFGRTEYEVQCGIGDFDGTWAIWDEPFLQYYAKCMDGMKEPFITSVFTATSHDPYNIPEEYQNVFLGGEDPFLKSVQYTDFALGRFFEYAKSQSWYNNTLFVITADHTNHSLEERYRTASGMMEVPVIFFSPTGEYPFEPGIDSTKIAQQIDIMPTVLDYIGYNRPYIAFGKSLISTPAEECYAVNYGNELFRYYKDDYILLFDGNKNKPHPISLYNLRDDILMEENILNNCDVQDEMIREVMAIIQQYMNRMLSDRLTIETDK
jgi:phosphoglycerol transferase MdoB-like AlkP superfamily enzyme